MRAPLLIELPSRQSDLKRTERHRSLLGRGEDTNRSDYEQSEPTETRPTTARRPEQARPTAGRRLAKARPAAATARSGRTAEARTAERPTLNFFCGLPPAKAGGFSYSNSLSSSRCLIPMAPELMHPPHQRKQQQSGSIVQRA